MLFFINKKYLSYIELDDYEFIKEYLGYSWYDCMEKIINDRIA